MSGRNGEREDREDGGLCKEREEKKKGGKERVMLVRLRPSRKRAEAGKEPDNRRETRTLAHCGILPSSTTLSQIPSQKYAHTATTQAHFSKLTGL